MAKGNGNLTALTQPPDFEKCRSMWGTLGRALFSDKDRRKVGFDLRNLISLGLCCQKTLSEAQSGDLHGNSLMIKCTRNHAKTHPPHSPIYLYSYAHLICLIETLRHTLVE